MSAGGWSSFCWKPNGLKLPQFGSIHETDGKVPRAASSRKLASSLEYQRQEAPRASRWRTNEGWSYNGGKLWGWPSRLPAARPQTAYKRFGQVAPGTELNQRSQTANSLARWS